MMTDRNPARSFVVHLITRRPFIRFFDFLIWRWQNESTELPVTELSITQFPQFSPVACDIAKWAFTTRRVDRSDVRGLSMRLGAAKAGDLILCEIAEIGYHKKIQLAERRAPASYPGDFVVPCLGDRYAPDQFLASAIIDDDLMVWRPVAVSRGGWMQPMPEWKTQTD